MQSEPQCRCSIPHIHKVLTVRVERRGQKHASDNNILEANKGCYPTLFPNGEDQTLWLAFSTWNDPTWYTPLPPYSPLVVPGKGCHLSLFPFSKDWTCHHAFSTYSSAVWYTPHSCIPVFTGSWSWKGLQSKPVPFQQGLDSSPCLFYL
jgi:hypothetical protein